MDQWEGLVVVGGLRGFASERDAIREAERHDEWWNQWVEDPGLPFNGMSQESWDDTTRWMRGQCQAFGHQLLVTLQAIDPKGRYELVMLGYGFAGNEDENPDPWNVGIYDDYDLDRFAHVGVYDPDTGHVLDAERLYESLDVIYDERGWEATMFGKPATEWLNDYLGLAVFPSVFDADTRDWAEQVAEEYASGKA